MRTRQQQKGMTLIGWIFVLGLIGLTAIIILRLLPIYMDSFKIKGQLETLHKEPNITRKSEREIRTLIAKRFNVEGLDSINKDDIKIEKKAGILTITADYELRTKLLGNLDAVGVFLHEVEIIQN